MPDKLTPSQRHYNMSRIRAKDTKPEMIVRKYLWSRGFRYRLNHHRLPGKPDIVLRKYRTCIFINGCFWHKHEGCKYFVLPKTRTEFWLNKVNRNQERDREVQELLAKMGWHCITIWECDLKERPLSPLPQMGEPSASPTKIRTLREKTLESLELTLGKIYLQDHSIKRYELPKEGQQMVAEEMNNK